MSIRSNFVLTHINVWESVWLIMITGGRSRDYMLVLMLLGLPEVKLSERLIGVIFLLFGLLLLKLEEVMNIDAAKIGISSAISFGILWLVCSTAVHFMPQSMMMITGHMIHADLTTLEWTLTLSGFLTGLVAWALIAGVGGWLIASIYNGL